MGVASVAAQFAKFALARSAQAATFGPGPSPSPSPTFIRTSLCPSYNHYLPLLPTQGNLRVCKECCEIFTEFRMAKLKGPDKASQPSDSAMSDHSPSVSHPPSLQVGVEANQQLQGTYTHTCTHACR